MISTIEATISGASNRNPGKYAGQYLYNRHTNKGIEQLAWGYTAGS